MYGSVCAKGGLPCKNRSCLTPQPCDKLKYGHNLQMKLLQEILNIPKIKKAFISTGIRYDMVVNDKQFGSDYTAQLVKHHISGQIKIAPEHYDNEVLHLMNKPSIKPLMRFKAMFDDAVRAIGKKYFLTYYLIAAHPGCAITHMFKLKDFLRGGIKTSPEQVQIFTPTPSTLSAAMYWCETDPSGNKIFVEKNPIAKQKQKDLVRGGFDRAKK
jgi:uncharacterized radical SAM protein YgiQ